MKHLSIANLLLLLLCLIAPGWLYAAATPRASVDRSVVTEGDSITLTIRVDATGSFEAPDYGALQKDFQVFDSSESSQHVLNNGRLESWTEWQTTLMPKRSGELVIPPLTVADGETQALTIRVNPASQSATESNNEPVFMETQLDHQSVYVQQQLLLTVRIFQAIQLDDLHLSEPAFDNASVRKVAETSFRRDIKGTTYIVHELSYAIFPQQAGELTIPELVFSAVQPTARRSLFDFPGQGRALRKMSRQMQIPVKPIPKTFSGAVWLPAKNLTLTDSWSDKSRSVAVGDSITRNIAIHADGLLAAQLPALDTPKLDNAKIYNDKPTLDDQQDASGVHAKRVENIALIPSKTGELQLPEIRVVWWDVDSDSEKTATLAASTLHIGASAQSSTNAAVNAEPPPQLAAPAASAPQLNPLANTAPPTLRWWQAATALLALAWLTTLYCYWRLRRSSQRAAPPTTEAAALSSAAANEDAAFRHLKEACRANNPAAARHALSVWAQHFYGEPTPPTLERVLQISNNNLLIREIRQLDNRLFGTQPETGSWNGESLLSVVRELRGKRAEKTTTQVQLPPLYPA